MNKDTQATEIKLKLDVNGVPFLEHSKPMYSLNECEQPGFVSQAARAASWGVPVGSERGGRETCLWFPGFLSW